MEERRVVGGIQREKEKEQKKRRKKKCFAGIADPGQWTWNFQPEKRKYTTRRTGVSLSLPPFLSLSFFVSLSLSLFLPRRAQRLRLDTLALNEIQRGALSRRSIARLLIAPFVPLIYDESRVALVIRLGARRLALNGRKPTIRV